MPNRKHPHEIDASDERVNSTSAARFFHSYIPSNSIINSFFFVEKITQGFCIVLSDNFKDE